MDQAYVLDRAQREFDRLDLQGILYADATRRALLSAGFTAEQVDGIEASLRDQALANNGVLVCWPVVSACCRLPG